MREELELHVVPVVLGDGARLFDNLGDAEVQLEQVRAVEAPGVTHLKYTAASLALILLGSTPISKSRFSTGSPWAGPPKQPSRAEGRGIRATVNGR